MKLLTPGPVQLPQRVVEALAKQPIFHRGEEFRQLLKDVLGKLEALFPGYTPIVMPGTGTTAVDAAVYNFVDPGERVLVVVAGEFGERLAQTVEARGAEAIRLVAEPGEYPSAEAIVDELARCRCGAVALVHNETSMGVATRELGKVVEGAKALGARVIVDSVSGIPAEPIPSGIDVVASASHKAFMAPPGASILLLGSSPTARSPTPPAYDLRQFLKYRERMETPYTPPIHVLYALQVSLEIIGSVDRYAAQQAERAELLYSEMERAGYRAVPTRRENRSHTVAAFYGDPGRAVECARRAGYVIAGGMWKLRDRSFRIGVMGDVSPSDIRAVASAIAGCG